jgi:hypothetical protein
MVAIVSAQAATAEDTWRTIPLIENGKPAAAWKHVGWGSMKVEGDSLVTISDERGLGLFVYTKEKLGDCQIRIVYQPEHARSNSGVYVRIDDGILDWVGKEAIAVEREDDGGLSPEMLAKLQEASEQEDGAWYAVHHGFEVQLADSGDPMHCTGSIYSLAPSKFDASATPKDSWRTMTITLDGDVVKVEQEGKLLSQFDSSGEIPPRKNWHEPKREPVRPRAGYIGLQTHDPGDVVRFREISVRKLEK